ncbi:MAG: serine/threonine protein kinase [Cyanobacteria bacterium HKST-UBA02]|nr:serine/threonine protein kinase [Cyanobacteria bacterium HKST-UBA02]
MSISDDTPTPVLGEPLEPSLDETDPRTITSRYVVLDRLGEGGMGRVYRALDPLIDRQVAIKVLRFEDPSGELVKRLQQEARTAGRLDHPGIVKVLDFGLVDGHEPFLVMEYVDGETLESLLERRKSLTLEELKTVFGQVVSAMRHAHEKGVLHRDLKPSNILIQNDECGFKAYVLDFGIAKVFQGGESLFQTQSGRIVGSPKYVSPEQISGEKLTESSDIYSLGCVMFKALTGSVPFEGESLLETLQMHLQDRTPGLAEKTGDSYSDQLESLIARSLAKRPEDRFQSMNELGDALESLVVSMDASAPIAQETATGRSSTFVPGVILCAFALVGLLSCAFFFSSRDVQSTRKPERLRRLDGFDINAKKDQIIIDEDMQKNYESGKLSFLADAKPHNSEFLQALNQTTKIDDELNSSWSEADGYKGLIDELGGSLRILREGSEEQLSECKSLLLGHANLNRSEWGRLSKCTNLENLNLTCASVTDEDLRYLRSLKKLKCLILTGTQTTADGIKKSLADNRNLRVWKSGELSLR